MSDTKVKVVIEVKKGLADVMAKTKGVEVVIVDKDDDIELVYDSDEEVSEKE